MSRKHLAFDLGASSGRAIVGWADDVSGTLRLEEVHRFTNYPAEEDGRFYWDFPALCNELKTGLKKAFAFAEDIATFSVDTWGVDVVFFRDGKPVRRPHCYRDPAFAAAAEEVHAKHISAADCFAETGIQPLSINTLYQLYADKQDHPEDFASGNMALFMPDALLYVLTGNTDTEYTIASTGELLMPEKRDWNHDLLERLDIPAEILTKITEPCTLSAVLRPEICAELGIPSIPCVKCASHDTASAVFAAPFTDADSAAYISLGTWALLGAETKTPDLSEAAYLAKYTNEGGAAGTIRFLKNITGTWLFQETKRTWNEAGDPVTFAEMEAMAKTAETAKRFNPNDPIFAAPGNMPERISQVCGAFADKAELLRCIYESLADCFAESLRELENLRGCRYSRLHILGGGTKDSFLMQLTADRTGKEVLAGPVEATAIGNILAQLLACGEVKDLNGCRELVRHSFDLKNYHPEK